MVSSDGLINTLLKKITSWKLDSSLNRKLLASDNRGSSRRILKQTYHTSKENDYQLPYDNTVELVTNRIHNTHSRYDDPIREGISLHYAIKASQWISTSLFGVFVSYGENDLQNCPKYQRISLCTAIQKIPWNC
jgi:hypothetical protein